MISLKKIMGCKGISPLIATLLLIGFALVIGTATMNWGKIYVSKADSREPIEYKFDSAVLISYEKIDTPLKEMQIKYIIGQIPLEDYLIKEKEYLNQS